MAIATMDIMAAAGVATMGATTVIMAMVNNRVGVVAMEVARGTAVVAGATDSKGATKAATAVAMVPAAAAAGATTGAMHHTRSQSQISMCLRTWSTQCHCTRDQ